MPIGMAAEESAKDCLQLAMITLEVNHSPFKLFVRRNGMLDQSIVTYCICDEIIKIFGFEDDPQCKMSTSEVMTFAIMSALLFGCDYKKTRLISLHHKYFKNILSHSRLVRRIHQIPNQIWVMVFMVLKMFLQQEEAKYFIVDSFPIKAYENHKSFRAKIFATKKYHGYTASKKQYFFGIKVHMVIDTKGIPIELLFTPGSTSDMKTLREFSFLAYMINLYHPLY